MKRAAVIMLLAVLLTGCDNSDTVQQISVSEANGTMSYESDNTASEGPCGTADDSVTEEADTEHISDDRPAVDWSSFSLSELAGVYESAQPLYYTAEKMSDTASAAHYSAAVEALRSSEYFAEAEQTARELFVCENANITPASEHFWTGFHKDDIMIGGDGQLTVSEELVYSCEMAFDGENTEQIYVFRIPLPLSELEWSGQGDFYVPVYINSAGNTFILCEAAAQTMSQPVVISYEDGISHVEFGRGHSSGTAWSVIFGFSSGQPFLLHECSMLDAEQGGSCILREDNCIGYTGYNLLFFRDKELGYCMIKGELLSAEQTELIAAHPAISEKYPDIAEKTLYITGGRYITSTDNDCFELTDEEVIPYRHGVIIPVADSFERVPDENILSIDLNIYE